ncbi:uncharacterized protein LOC103518426 isoform X1 [Diaphorina citri]|uniref:Uncharacterized protein LOC103518426 isoform X1 n=1 Tax=Diaphorina citri TaxID=121845 RepID=A0A1S3DH13_DIACI|nr:uncharacterized protein LOC103518426 isoform X1 [Diaphorina citri]
MCLSCYLPVCLTCMPLTSILLIMGVGTLATGIAANYARKGPSRKVRFCSQTTCGPGPPGPGPCCVPCEPPKPPACPQCTAGRPVKIMIYRSPSGHTCQKSILKRPRDQNCYRAYQSCQPCQNQGCGC